MRALLDVHSFFSFGAGASSPTALVGRARALGYSALALVDDGSVGGAVELWQAAKRAGIKPLIGATVALRHERERYPLSLIALSRGGYGNLNALLSALHAQPGERRARGAARQDAKSIQLDTLLAHASGLALLTGARHGFPARLLAERRPGTLRDLLKTLHDVFGERLFVQLFHDRYPHDDRRARLLRDVARDARLPVVAGVEVRYADLSLYPLYDALTCARLGIDVDTPHERRPRNDAQYLMSPEELERRLPFPEALANTDRLVAMSELELLGERLIPPPARLPLGLDADHYLETECYARLRDRYPAERLHQAKETLARELHILERYGFAEFFLVAAEITDYCRSRGILAAGRGSAAGSVVCYLLGITQADPIRHGLLFERFLHTGMTSFPDVDIDIASSRRDEVLAWVEERFGSSTEAMVANRIRYRLPLAVQDLGRALGLLPEQRNRLSRALGRDYRRLAPRHARQAQVVFDEVLAHAPVKEVLIELLENMETGFVRHLAPHSGGVVLARDSLHHYSPLQRSSGGIRLLQFDKDDIEALGLIKLDLLGLRMLAALERAREEVYRNEGVWLDLADLPDEEAIWERIARGETMGLFQIESPSQMRISVELKPRSLAELAHQVALIRPGPIQSGTVHPYLRRRRGEERVRYLHDSLRPILEDTYGVILFQEQILRIAKKVAGMSWTEADRFRKRVSGFGDLEDIEPERRAFVEGVRATVGASDEEANAIFEAVKAFQGFGFAESHAWAFAMHAYASTWLRHHYPAEYLAALLTEAPGMWAKGTLRQEAERWGVPLLRLDINRSGLAYRCERDRPEDEEVSAAEARKAVLPPLTAVKALSREAARTVVLDRLANGPYTGLADLYSRVALEKPQLEALVRAGAFDRLGARRALLFELQALANAQRAGQPTLFGAAPRPPRLPRLELRERVAWDTELKGFSELSVHPLDLMRQELLELGAEPFIRLKRTLGRASRSVRTAGLVVARQKPPTAKGFAFFMLEDGPERAQLIIGPDLWERHRVTLRDAPVLVVDGELSHAGSNLSLRAEALWGVPTRLGVRGYHYG